MSLEHSTQQQQNTHPIWTDYMLGHKRNHNKTKESNYTKYVLQLQELGMDKEAWRPWGRKE